jgi:tetratricopeptide (TPR) repeat protein
MSTPGRNSPCPCGSGKRYKDCHGAIPGAMSPIQPADDATRRALDAALAAQREGRLAEAANLYAKVLADQPDTFDALHMLGVVHYQRGEFEQAHARLVSALRVRPSDAGARHNLQLIESVLERRMVERDICRETLPRLARRCVAGGAGDGRRWRDASLDVVVSTADPLLRWDELGQLMRWLHAKEATVWLYPEMRRPAGTAMHCREIDAGAGALPRHAQAIFFGTARSPAAWYAQATATDVALYCDDDAPCAMLDRIPMLAREGRTPLTLLFPSPERLRRTGLPGIVVDSAGAPS